MLKKREYTGKMMSKEDGSLCMVDFSIDFIPTTLNDQEVYEVKKENDHYCYMTPAMVDKIFELRPGGKDRYVDSFSFTLAIRRGYFVKLKNKLLLDLPEKVDANSFDSMTFPFIQYTEDVKKEPIVLKVQRQYHLDGLGKDGGAIELILPNNKLECNNFKIYSQQKTDQILEINAKNSKMDAVFVDNLSPSNDTGSKEVHLSVDFKDEGGILFVQYGSVPTFSGKNGHINFKTGKNFYLNDAAVKTTGLTNDLSNVIFSSSKGIEIEKSNITLQKSGGKSTNDQIGIKGGGNISIHDSLCGITDLIINDGGLYVSQKKKRGEIDKYDSQVVITGSSFLSPTYISPAKKRLLIIKETLVDNGKAKVTIDGNTLVLNSKILGNNNKPITISTSSVRLSEIIDTNNIAEALISNTKKTALLKMIRVIREIS